MGPLGISSRRPKPPSTPTYDPSPPRSIFRCLRSLRKFLKKKNIGGTAADGANDEDEDDDDDGDGDDEDGGGGVAEEEGEGEDFCSWCAEYDDKKLFFCDGDACGRCVLLLACSCSSVFRQKNRTCMT